jgi:hypothetical protein
MSAPRLMIDYIEEILDTNKELSDQVRAWQKCAMHFRNKLEHSKTEFTPSDVKVLHEYDTLMNKFNNVKK